MPKASTIWAVSHRACDALEAAMLVMLILWIAGLYLKYQQMIEIFSTGFFIAIPLWVFMFFFCIRYPREGAAKWDTPDGDGSSDTNL